jgi:hypothetical protein
MKSLVIVALFFFVPVIVFGQDPEGLVTCSGPDCNFCTFVTMVDKVISFIFTLMVLGAVLMMVFAGFKLVVSQGDEHAMGEAKSMITNVVVGFVIVMSAWLIVDTMMKALLKTNSDFGIWNEVKGCGTSVKNALTP